MNRDIEQKIKYDCEGSTLDYKKEEYPLGKHVKRNEILKDISTLANHHSDEDKYIIIGVKEENGIAKDFYEIERLTDEASYQNFVIENIEPKINFEYKSFVYDGKKLAYFKIFNNKLRPYLFKKNIQNPVANKTDYKIGDGFIKIGSSSKKMDRTDFENIYRTRFTEEDRKGDLKIETYFASSNDDELSKLDIEYLDIKITNQSNKSIDFDIEMRVFKGDGYAIVSEDEIKKELKKSRKKSSAFGFDIEMIQPQINNMHIDFEEEEEFVFIARNSLARATAISLPQNSSEEDIFCQHLFVVENEAHEIMAELIIRSDDFTEGLLKKELIFKR
jgi:predicted HTH transcriptional regulator